jgi:Mn-dependent DtxR family transcriptional regulator
MTKQFFPTRRERDCMVTIHENSSREFPIRLSEIAKIMGMKPPTVIEILKRLESKGLITREKGMVILTDAGKESYNFITNCHRILETIFVDSGIDLEEACREVSAFDYMINSESAMKLSNFVGKPTACPHGKPIIYR